MLNQYNKDKYDQLVRLCSLLASVLMLWISATFSQSGFAFTQPGKEWIGWALAIILIVVEIVWNKKGAKHGVTLYVGGLACYVYGLYTNILGILVTSGQAPAEVGGWLTIIASFVTLAISHPVALIGGIMLELLPEPLLVWSLTGDSLQADPLAHMADWKFGTKSRTPTAMEHQVAGSRQSPSRPYQSPDLRPASQVRRPAPRTSGYSSVSEPTYHPVTSYGQMNLRDLNAEDDET